MLIRWRRATVVAHARERLDVFPVGRRQDGLMAGTQQTQRKRRIRMPPGKVEAFEHLDLAVPRREPEIVHDGVTVGDFQIYYHGDCG